MGYSPDMWGRQAWHFIHMVALSYPQVATEETKKKYYAFFESLGHALPCPSCSKHYKEKFDKYPPPLENHNRLFEWTVDIHNAVNADNGKPLLSYEEAYAQVMKNADKKDYLLLAVSVSISLVSLICLFGYAMRKR